MAIDSDSAAAANAGTPSRFSGALLDILDQVSYARVDPAVIDDPIYRLRYRAYTREGFMDHNPEEVCIDDLDRTANGMSFGIYIDGGLVSSIRLHHLTADQPHSPSMKVFPDILGPMLEEGFTFIDPSRFTADHEASLAYPALPFLTLRMAAMASVYFEASQCLALVRPEHGPFYKRVFGSEQLSAERSYPDLHFPVALFAATVDSIRARVAQRFPFFLSTEAERQQLFSQVVARSENPHVPASARQALQGAIEARALELSLG
ncbi:MAG: N-acyl amino acid synthase FeeM domain-containing protein [Devosia sp.]